MCNAGGVIISAAFCEGGVIMKKKIVGTLLLCFVLLAGCTSDQGSSRGSYDADASATPTDKAPEPTEEPDKPDPVVEVSPTPTPEAESGFTKAYHASKEEIAGYLDGTWLLHEGDNKIQPVELLNDTLTFDASDMSATYHMAYAAEEAYYSFELLSPYDAAPQQYCMLRFTGKGSTDGFPFNNNGGSIDYLIMLANDEGCDRLFIQEMGNGISELGHSIMGEDRQVSFGCWLFERDWEESPKMGERGFNMGGVKRPNDSFFALQFSEYGDSCTLQEVVPVFEEFDLEGSITARAAGYAFCDNGYPFNAVVYEYADMEQWAHSGCYSPGLVEVYTNGDGEISNIIHYPYFAYGHFNQVATGALDVERDPAVYGDMDKEFLGSWISKDDGISTLDISQADPQTGGYYLVFEVYRLCGIEAYANIDMSGDKLSINQGYVNDKLRFSATLERKGDELRVTVTESEFEHIPEGTVMIFTAD